MATVQFLTTKDISPNTHSIIYPLLRWEKSLNSEIGVTKIVSNEVKENSDIIILDSKYHKYWWLDKNLGQKAVLEDIERIKKKCNKLVYFDTTDSSGSIQKEVFQKINQYWKGQTLVEKKLYKKNFFYDRVFTDYYKRKYFKEVDNAQNSEDILTVNDILKIKTAWNSSLTSYKYIGGRIARFATKYKIGFLLNKNIVINEIKKIRRKKISCRIFSDYNNQLISWQREKARYLLEDLCDTNLISKRKYHKELSESKITFSPFGWGEICYRDFEAYCSGSLLIKPSMEHIETWPNLYINNQTYIACRWDLEDLIDLINKYSNKKELQIPKNAQSIYNRFLDTVSGQIEFTKRYKNLVTELLES
ncbi:hypothetical protein [Acinetobacter sp.]|uniref:hypothetical protein n=1 Tax=Acinetobacter sp. TaxID=472 RepID=UPI000C4E4E2F|nr:hypothetical protein [Acinetobacter sp.]MBC69483.1 hypothetical protein [Acinetobacter sp.]